MTAIEVASFVAAVASLVLSITAISLSIVFYKMTVKLSEQTGEASKSISSGVERLEKLFDKLYSDTHSMLRDTYTDIRKHMWPEPSDPTTGVSLKVGQEADKVRQEGERKLEGLKLKFTTNMDEILKSQHLAEEKQAEMQKQLNLVVEGAITESRDIEKKVHARILYNLITDILSTSDVLDVGMTASEIVQNLRRDYLGGEIIPALMELVNTGVLLHKDGTKKYMGIRPNTVLMVSGS